MIKNLTKVAIDVNKFLKTFLKKQKTTSLLSPMSYGLLPGGKKLDLNY